MTVIYNCENCKEQIHVMPNEYLEVCPLCGKSNILRLERKSIFDIYGYYPTKEQIVEYMHNQGLVISV